MESKDKYSISNDLKRRGFNIKGILNIIKYSVSGIKCYAGEGKSIILYTISSIIEILLGIIFKISGLEWILIIVILGFILSVELLNTAIEKTCDAISLEYNTFIRDAKDCGSAATFVLFIVAIILNLIIFLPKIVSFF